MNKLSFAAAAAAVFGVAAFASLHRNRSDEPKSGLAVGDRVPAFNPLHITGADAGTSACPV